MQKTRYEFRFSFLRFSYSITILLLFVSYFAFSREPVVSGQFYPSDKDELLKTIKNYFDSVKNLPKIDGEIIGIMVPHAGYIFSGQVAAYSFKLLRNYNVVNPIIILIGESHNFYLDKPSVYYQGNFKTPIGEVLLEKKLVEQIIKQKDFFSSDPRPHMPEHSLEVEVPFLQYIFEQFSIVPILVSKYDYTKTIDISEKLYNIVKMYQTKRKIIVVCSSDLSHYPKYEDANLVDKKVLSLIEKYDVKNYYYRLSEIENKKVENLQCALCGQTAVGITMHLTKLLGANSVKVLNYANSADVPIYGEKKRVVGYGAVAFLRKNKLEENEEMTKEKKEGFSISKENQKFLLDLARKAIKNYLRTGSLLEVKTQDEELLTPSAVFVTLKKDEQLRGCIGTTFPQEPLYKAVINMAIAAATEDFRFKPLTEQELEKVKIEISILSPLKRVFSPKDIKENIHGVVVRRDGRSGLFLPQVWEHLPKKEDFLRELCWSKAGLQPDAWKDSKTELYIFEVFAFSE